MKYGLPPDLVAELNNEGAFITDPDGRRRALFALGLEARRRRHINEGQLADFLELVDAGRDWALLEHEEACALGIFSDQAFDEREGSNYWDGKSMAEKTGNAGMWCAAGREPEKGR